MLLNSLIERLEALKDKQARIVNSLVCDGFKQINNESISTGQERACLMSSTQPITFIWGPPGTGKTETLANIALKHLSNGERVLMLSYSNVSVDGAILRVYKKYNQFDLGEIIRYGYPRDKWLLQHEYLTSYNLVLHNHPELLIERKNLISERRHLTRTAPRYVEIGQELARIRRKLDKEERAVVRK